MSSFDYVSKHQSAELTLAACLGGGRLPHAMLVEGAPEDGTFLFAQKIARGALCPENHPPCGKCRDCLKTEKGVHPDLLVYGGGEGARSFHIDVVRELRREAFIRPNEAGRKVFILKNVQNMSVQAQNALLKIIEEPPKNVFFILTCENKAVLLETVLSRVTVFTLDISPARETEAETELREKAMDVLWQLCAGSELNALAAFAPYERDRAGFIRFIAVLRGAAADELLAKTKDSSLERGKGRRINRLQLLRIIAIIDEAQAAAAQNVSGLLLTTMIPAKFRQDMR